MTPDEIAEMARIGKAAMQANLFTVRPISNGFLMDYDDVEEFEIKRPTMPGPRVAGHPRPQLGVPPEMETVRRWKVKRKEVFCADAQAIKDQVDEALKLSEKIKLKKAEDVLSGQSDTDYLALRP